MQIIIAPEAFQKKENQIGIFLAGGITNCSEWQNEVIKCLNDMSKYVEDGYNEYDGILYLNIGKLVPESRKKRTENYGCIQFQV